MTGLRLPPETRQGVRDILPVMFAAVPLGVLFGAIAHTHGLSVLEAGLMSLLVLAGGAQFAVIELWVYPLPVLALLFSTLLINARHILMGASLAPKFSGFSRLHQLFALFFMVDESWALAERRAQVRPVTPAYWWGVAGVMPVAWTLSTVLGALLGAFIGDPSRIGADFVFAALFIALIVGFWRGRDEPDLGMLPRFAMPIAIVGASGVASALAYVVVGSPWYVAAGAVAGIAAAYFMADEVAE
jgi:4-azaleucine resistance transporter AzlC